MATVYFEITIGTPPFAASINPAVAPDKTGLEVGTHFFEDVPDGNYTIIVTDALGYVTSFPVNVQCEPTTTTSSSSTTLPEGYCGNVTTYDGGVEYGGEYVITVGTDTGQIAFQVNPLSVPDRFILYWNNNEMIDTGYRGSASYAYGGNLRHEFTDALEGKIDPVTGNTYPFADPSHQLDNYPYVNPHFSGYYTYYFNKTAPYPETVTVKTYAPITTTAWYFIVNCPGVDPATTTTSSSTTSTSSTTEPPGGLETVFIHIPNS